MKALTIAYGVGLILAGASMMSVADAANRACNSAMGLTWGKYAPYPDTVTGTNSIGCHSTAEGHDCNPYTGDTKCNVARPLLCIHQDTTAFPVPADVNNLDPYNMWGYGAVGTTKPIKPCQVATTIQQANAICVAEFGAGFRVAEWHDAIGGLGTAFQVFGGLGNTKRRVWVDINSTNGTCWTH